MAHATFAAAAFLAALGSCDAGEVVEPEPALEIVPDSVTLTHLGQEFGFSVRDGAGPGAGQVGWSSRDTTVFVVDADGAVTARGNGVARVQAWTPESSDHALVRVRQATAALEPIGSGQRTTPGQPPLDPVGVRLLDSGGAPVSKAAVRFDTGPGSGRVEPREVNSDSAGVAVAEWTLGPRPGRQLLKAISPEGGVSAEIEAIALDPDEAAAALGVRSGDDQWALAGQALPESVAVRVLDEAGRPVWGASVRFEPEAGSGHADPGVAVTDRLGLASAVWTLGREPGAQQLVATAADFEVVFAATAVSDQGVCNRTPAVSAEIARTARAANCAAVTGEMLGTIVGLNLSGNGIRELRSGDFVGLSSLTDLTLDDNALTALPPDIFEGLSRLERLYLSRNRLRELAPEIFVDLEALEWLFFYYNELTELPEDLFAGTPNLRLLLLRGNGLLSLPEDVFDGLSKLEEVSLAENQLTELAPGLLAENPAVRRINLASNELNALPSGLFWETQMLQRLHLQRNRLETLPADIFAQLRNLARLDLGDNLLAELPTGIFDGTPKLAQLSLESNELSELPYGVFAGLSKLEWATLERNPGAPFLVRPEFARVDDDDLLSPGPATVVLRVPIGAPLAFDGPLSVQRGTVSRDFVSLLPGDTVSAPFVVTGASADVAVHVGFGPPEVAAGGYTGLAVERGEELVLFAEADNRSPFARSPVPKHRMQAEGPSAELALSDYFGDSDGDPLTYDAAATVAGVVEVGVEDSVLRLDPLSVDTTEVVVTATDAGGLRATQRFRAWVVPAPDPDAFNIELYFDPGFKEEEEAAIRRAADRWMEAVTGDLPDVPVEEPLSDICFDGPSPPRMVGVIDDLLIRMRLVGRLGANAATAATCGVREESGQAFLGRNSFALWYFRHPDQVANELYAIALHEMGHVLGFGDWTNSSDPQAWRKLFRGRRTDPHFAGPLAVAAFNAAGGKGYSGGKVPLEDRLPVVGIHWRQRVIPGDVMAPHGDSLLTAITLQALVDLGHQVDLSKADPYTLPGQAQGDAQGAADAGGPVTELLTDDVIEGPVVVVARDGKVVRIIRP